MLTSEQKDTLIAHLSQENASLRLTVLSYQIALAPDEEGESDAPDTD